jgi:hypothetical protein
MFLVVFIVTIVAMKGGARPLDTRVWQDKYKNDNND